MSLAEACLEVANEVDKTGNVYSEFKEETCNRNMVCADLEWISSSLRSIVTASSPVLVPVSAAEMLEGVVKQMEDDLKDNFGAEEHHIVRGYITSLKLITRALGMAPALPAPEKRGVVNVVE